MRSGGGVSLCGVLLLALAPASGAALEECELEYDAAASEDEELLERLQRDPFAEALTAHIRDLKQVVDEAEEQEAFGRRWAGEVCRPFVARRDRYEADVGTFNGQCGGEISDPDFYQSCVRRLDALNARKAALDADVEQVNSGQARINSWADELVAKGERPRREARFILDPENLDDALWLYAERMRRDAGSDCAAMAKILGALGRKVDDAGDLVGWAGAIISRAANPFAFASDRGELTFGSAGFKPEYADPGNQVRHFVAYLALGVKTPTTRLREIVASCRDLACDGPLCREFLREECSLPDYRLGVVAAELGNRLDADPSLLKGNLEGYVFGAACR